MADNTPRSESPDYSDMESLRVIVQRLHELEDRGSLLDLEEISLRRTANELDSVEAALNEQKVIAAAADRLVKRRTFRDRFCSLYAAHEPLATTVETVADLAEKICAVINEWYPTLNGQLAVVTLSAVVILKKGLDAYCPPSIRGDQTSAGATV